MPPSDQHAASFRLAHLSDPHLAPLPPASLAQLASKRLTGFLSWQIGRKHIHMTKALDTVCADIARGGFNHIAVTGDVANISLPAEFDRGAEFLARLGTPSDVTVVPGNHDAYVAVDWSESWQKWSRYMTGDVANDDGRAPLKADRFPFLRRRGPVALVGLNTGVPEPWFFATGTLGRSQLARAEEMLAALAKENLFRLVLIHHPPQFRGAPFRKRLTDGLEFQQMIGRVGAELIVHGHMHRPVLGRVHGPKGPVPVLGVASASTDVMTHYGAGGYQSLAISQQADSWGLEVEVRQLAEDYAGCKPISQFRMTLPKAA